MIGLEKDLILTLVGMALTPWFADVKAKCEKGESPRPGPAKILCTFYEKQLKQLPGNLSLIKVRDFFDLYHITMQCLLGISSYQCLLFARRFSRQ